MATEYAGPQTNLALFAWATRHLCEKGTDSPVAEVERLSTRSLRAGFRPQADDRTRTAYCDRIRRRSDGRPKAYRLGHCEFSRLMFDVNPSVLIPRPDTELLLDAALAELRDRPPARVLDLGTGSGCLAISLAVRVPSVRIVATDLSPAALQVARANAARHRVENRLEFREGDMFAPVAGERFDIVMCNPPFIRTRDLASLPDDARNYEPQMAFDGGPDGLAFHRRIAAEAPEHLRPGGVVFVKVGGTQGGAVRAVFASTLTIGKCIPDTSGVVRVVEARGGQPTD